MRLRKVTGPECPRCGCQAGTVVDRFTRWGQKSEKRQCNHCGMVFSAAAVAEPDAVEVTHQEAVIWRPHPPCPKCSHPHCPITSTRGRKRNLTAVGAEDAEERAGKYRYHKCGSCGHCFNSVEE